MTVATKPRRKGDTLVFYVDGVGVQDGIDFDAAYRIPGHSGVAWRLLGWAATWEADTTLMTDDEGNEWEEPSDEGEWVPDTDHVIAEMIGDDRWFTFDREEPVIIAETEFCHSCGQIGCMCNVPEEG